MSNRIEVQELLNFGNPVISVNYCKLQGLLNNYSRDYYIGFEHWNADVFAFDHGGRVVYICTGKSPVGTIEPPNDLNKRYDNKAREISSDYDLTIEYRYQLLDKLLQAYIKEVLSE